MCAVFFSMRPWVVSLCLASSELVCRISDGMMFLLWLMLESNLELGDLGWERSFVLFYLFIFIINFSLHHMCIPYFRISIIKIIDFFYFLLSNKN